MLLNILDEFGKVFTQMHWVVILLLSLGIVLCIIEAVAPGFGLFGISGMLCEVIGVIIHAIISGSVLQVLFLLTLVVLVTLIIFLIVLKSAKNGILAKTAIVENKTALPKDFREQTENQLKHLIGKEGLTLTDCRPIGKIRIDNEIYEAQSIGAVISKGEVIRVTSIEDARIIISKITY